MNMLLTWRKHDLWVSPSSRFTALQNRYQDLYGPFYLVNSIILVPKNEGEDVLDKKYLYELFQLEMMVNEIGNNTLTSICLKPIPNGSKFR